MLKIDWSVYLVFGLYQPVVERPGPGVGKMDVAAQRTEKWDAAADENGYLGDDDLLYQASIQKTLDGLPAVDLYVFHAGIREFLDQFTGRAGSPFHRSGLFLRYLDRSADQHDDPLGTVWPLPETKHRFIRVAPRDQYIDSVHELLESKVFVGGLLITPGGPRRAG